MDPTRANEVFSKLLAKRIVLVAGMIRDDSANVTIAQMLFLQHENAQEPLWLWITSPGGLVSASLAIVDAIDALRCPVHTHGRGEVAGTALVLLAHGARGQRSVAPDARLQLTPTWVTEPHPSATAAEIARAAQVVTSFLVADTGQPEETIVRDQRAGRGFTADEARAYGLVDVVSHR